MVPPCDTEALRLPAVFLLSERAQQGGLLYNKILAVNRTAKAAMLPMMMPTSGFSLSFPAGPF